MKPLDQIIALKSPRILTLFVLPLAMALGLAPFAPLAAAERETDKDWIITIRPESNSQAAVSGHVAVGAQAQDPDVPVSAASGTTAPRMSYVEAYNSIPFSRAEYEANPGYRHEAAMELMTGVPRPVTNVRMTVPYFSRYPDFFRYRDAVFPYPCGGSTSAVYHYYQTSLIAY